MFRKNPFETAMNQGEKYLIKGEYEKSKEMYLKAFSMNPEDLGIINNLCQIYRLLEDDGKAKGYAEMLLKKCDELLTYERAEDFLILKANALLCLEKYEELNAVADELLSLDSESHIATAYKLTYFENESDDYEAINCINTLLKFDPRDINLILAKGKHLTNLNEFDNAERCYNIVLQRNAKDKNAITFKSELLKKKHGIEVTSHDYMLKAVENYELKNYEASENFYRKALEMDSNFEEIWFAQGELFAMMGKMDDALNSFEKAFEINPNLKEIKKENKIIKAINFMQKVRKTFHINSN